MMRHALILFMLFLFLVGAMPGFAQDTSLPPSATEVTERAREIGESLRCVVCQNQSIYESDAPLAEDMRRLVIKRLEQGYSNTEVMEYMQDKYGDYVLLKPPVQTNTYALWILPFLLLFGGLIWFFRTGQTSRQSDISS